MVLIKILNSFFQYYFDYIVRCRGNKVSYLRYLGVKIGEGCSIYTTIGNFGTEPWLIELGNKVTITSGVVFLTHDGSSRLFRDKIQGMNSEYGNRFGPIRVGDNSFIGVNTIILPEVSIGANAIVGAGSVVNHDVPDNMVYAGNPARMICSLAEYVEKYQAKMIPVNAVDRQSLRDELTQRFWGQRR